MMLWWFLLFLVLLVIELCTINLVTIWFAIGAIASMILSVITDILWIQVLVFIIVSLIALVVTKPLIKKFKKFKVEPTNSDRVIGKTGEVISEITTDNYGEVKVLNTIWTATSKKSIKKGKKVVVKKIEGVKLIVEEEEN